MRMDSTWEGGSSSQTSGTADTTYPTTNVGWFWREGGLQTNISFPNRPLKQNEAIMALSFCVEETGHGR